MHDQLETHGHPRFGKLEAQEAHERMQRSPEDVRLGTIPSLLLQLAQLLRLRPFFTVVWRLVVAPREK
jgi:hypothetical protein